MDGVRSVQYSRVGKVGAAYPGAFVCSSFSMEPYSTSCMHDFGSSSEAVAMRDFVPGSLRLKVQFEVSSGT